MRIKVILITFPPGSSWRKFLEVKNSVRTALIIFIDFLIVSFFSCSSDKSANIRIIDPGRIIEKKITLSEIATEINYIPLSNEILFGSVIAELTDSLIFIKPTNEGLLTYDFNGRLKSRISKKGKGPGEYISASEFTLDYNHRTVYILDSVNDKILKYSMNGDFLQEIRIKSEGQSFFSEIIFADNNIYLFEGINQGFGKFNWLVVDTLGEILSEKLNYIEKFPSYRGIMGNKQEAYNNTFYYWNQINDTIFKINNGEYKAAFLFAHGDFRFPKQKVLAVSTEYFYPRRIYFTKDYLFFSYNYQFKNCTGIYIRSEQKFYAVNKTEDQKFYFGPGILNDIDGGLPLIPRSYYLNKKNEEFLIGEIIPFELKAYITSKMFNNSISKFPEKKKALKKLADSLDDNDNLVLMLVKLKE